MSAEKPDENDHVYDDRHWFESDAEVAPEVIAGEPDGDTPVLGDVAYVPTEVELAPGDENTTLKVATTAEGERAALAYSSLEHLVRCCGDRHPWVAFKIERIDALSSVAKADVLLWNQELPPELRREADDGESGQGSEQPRRET